MSSHALPLFLALALAGSGCISTEMGRIKRDLQADIERDGTATVGKGYAMSLGRGTIGTSRFLGRLLAPKSTEPARRLGEHVRRVQVAQYSIEGDFDALALRPPAALNRYTDDGWYPLATVRDEDGAVWVLYNERPEDFAITDLLTVVAGDDGLVVTKISGDLTALVHDAVALGLEQDLFGDALGETGVLGSEPQSDDAPVREDTTIDASP
jgi:hypothetical protein